METNTVMCSCIHSVIWEDILLTVYNIYYVVHECKQY